MALPLWFVKLLKASFSRRFFIAKLTCLPVLGRLFQFLMFRFDDVIFLPSDRVIKLDVSVEASGQMVLPSQVVEHFIEQASFRWVMNFCICRSASHCEDYPIELGCLFLGDAARGINPRFGHPVTREEALNHVRRCREAGLVTLSGEIS